MNKLGITFTPTHTHHTWAVWTKEANNLFSPTVSSSTDIPTLSKFITNLYGGIIGIAPSPFDYIVYSRFRKQFPMAKIVAPIVDTHDYEYMDWYKLVIANGFNPPRNTLGLINHGKTVDEHKTLLSVAEQWLAQSKQNQLCVWEWSSEPSQLSAVAKLYEQHPLVKKHFLQLGVSPYNQFTPSEDYLNAVISLTVK
jgi:hypothetical protein